MTFKQLKIGAQFEFACKTEVASGMYNGIGKKLSARGYCMAGHNRIVGNSKVVVIPITAHGELNRLPAGGTGHTPGPWHVTPNGGEVRPEAIYAKTEHGEIILATTWIGVPEPQRKANVRLIAAAPDLLAALKDCVESLARMPDHDGAYRVTCLRQARAAISKAGGI
jgi:hypothetical protein